MHLWEIHPALVHFPIAFFILGTVLDIYGTRQGRPDLARMGQGSLLLGVGTGVIAAVFGLVAFLTVPYVDPAYGDYLVWHLAVNTLAMGAFILPVLTRWGSRWPAMRNYALGAEVLGCLFLLAGGVFGHAAVVRGGAGIRPEILAPRIDSQSDARMTTPSAAPRTP